MLAGEQRVFLCSPQIQVRVAEGMDVTGAAQSLTHDSAPAAFLRVRCTSRTERSSWCCNKRKYANNPATSPALFPWIPRSPTRGSRR